MTAVYSGDGNNASGTSAPNTLTISPVPVNMNVACWSTESFSYGGNYQCTVNIGSNAGAPPGSNTYVYDGGVAVTLPLNGGNAQFTITSPTAGNHQVTLGYAQQTNYAAATPQTEYFTVTGAPVNVALTPSTWYTSALTNISFVAAVTSMWLVLAVARCLKCHGRAAATEPGFR